MIKVVSIGIERTLVDIPVKTSAKFRYGTHGDISFWLEQDDNNIYTTYNPSINAMGNIRLGTINKLLEDIKKMPETEETSRWEGCSDVGFYDACYIQARNKLNNSFYSNRARELKEEITNMVWKRRSPLDLSLERLERIFDKYESFTTKQEELEKEACKWEKEVISYEEKEEEMRKNVCRKLNEYLDIRNNVLRKTVRSEHLFTVRIVE